MRIKEVKKSLSKLKKESIIDFWGFRGWSESYILEKDDKVMEVDSGDLYNCDDISEVKWLVNLHFEN
tara:strand:- start:505 stop:705 length:201 start_codon:yes stop_codon:yes gene_type:complete